jgi:cytochrome c biogenesis protein
VWFSAIYILLFISLIGCVIPRTRHHWTALRSRPPRTPARLSRLDDHIERTLDVVAGTDAAAEAARVIDVASAELKSMGYRVQRYDARGIASVSAERGYMRETGNLLFHAALVGVLVAVGIGGGFTFTGQRVVVEGTTFANTLTDYSSFNPGRFVNADTLTPYSMRLDRFDVTYQPPDGSAPGQAGDFAAQVTTTLDDGSTAEGEVRVNHPLSIGGDKVYLLGNGYAPSVTVRDASGTIVFSDAIPFLPQDAQLTSLGVVKVPDGLPDQLGMIGFFYPTAQPLASGALSSNFPDLIFPVLTLDVYAGDLGINDGTPRSVYTLDPSGMTRLTGGDTGAASIELQPGDTAALPNGWGTITFDDVSPAGATDYSESVKRFASLSIHRDLAAPWVLAFAVLALAGLLLGLFVPRRRLWVRATPGESTVALEYAGLARGEDPALRGAVEQLAQRHGDALDSPPRS